MESFMSFIETAEFWHWFAFAVALTILEILSPTFFFMWLGIAAGLTGLVLLINPDLSWQLQWVLFAVLSVISVIGGRAYIHLRPTQTDQPTLNRRGEQYVGRAFTLDSAIVNGVGKVHVDDTTWKIEGPDVPSGTTVRVIGVNGTILKIETVEDVNPG